MGDTINWGFFKRHFWGEYRAMRLYAERGPVELRIMETTSEAYRRNAGEERASFLTIMLGQIRSLAIMHYADIRAKNSGSSRRRSNRHYRSPAADVIRDQIEIVREIRRLMLHMQASDTA
jgi:hypothetical protein